MQEILQQENGSLPRAAPTGHPAGNRNLSSKHLRTVSFPVGPGYLTPFKIKMINKLMRICPTVTALALVVLTAVSVSAQTDGNGAMDPAEIDRIVRTFTAKEIEFRRALNQYSFKRDALIQKIGMGGQV